MVRVWGMMKRHREMELVVARLEELQRAIEAGLTPEDVLLLFNRQQAAERSKPVEPRVFTWLALILPRRLWNEDLGDALEMLHVLEAQRAPRWQRWLLIGSTTWWCLVNAIREVVSAFKGE